MKTEKTTIAKAGQLISIDNGTYSDYEVIGFFVVLKDFYPMAEVSEFVLQNTEKISTNGFRPDEFLPFLLSKGLLLEIEHANLYLGDWHAESVSFTPIGK